ncbi:MAG TPA: hypothetical protein VLZ54_00510, partial [Arenibacter sp.]|nr:hypothetical protein [Arenibacter sp.]
MVILKEVRTRAELKDFVKFPFSLYKDSPYWVPPLINEELASFDRNQNPVFQNADAWFFLAYKDNKIVGRMAAIVNRLEVEQQKIRKMRFGWFDFIDDYEVTETMFN